MEQAGLPNSSLRVGLWLFIYMAAVCVRGLAYIKEKGRLLGWWCATHPHSPGSGFQPYRGEAGPVVEGAPPWPVRGSDLCGDLGDKEQHRVGRGATPSPVLGASESGVLAQMLAASWAWRQLHWWHIEEQSRAGKKDLWGREEDSRITSWMSS